MLKPTVDTIFKNRRVRADEGARAVVYLAASPYVDGVTGAYFENETTVPSSAASQDVEAAGWSWRVSEGLTSLPAPEDVAAMKETVCVTGGSGGIGQALLERLTELYEVKALFRTKNETSDRWERRGCTAVWGDVTNEEALSQLVTGARTVFHCAAVMYGSYKEAYRINVEGTRTLARMAAMRGCRRFVYLSSAAVYSGGTGDSDYTEDTELSDHDDMAVYGLTKLQSERALQAVAQECGIEYTILRPTCVYGPHTKPYTLLPIDLIRKGLPVILGDGRGLLDAVDVDDVVSALLLAAQAPQASGQVFNIGHETVTLNDFYSCYGRMLNRPARRLPIWFVNAILRLLSCVPGTFRAKLPELRKGARFLIQMSGNTRRFPSSKAMTLLGYAPRFNLLTGMLKTELWAKHQRLVPRAPYSLDAYGPLLFRPLCVVHPVTQDDIVQTIRIALGRNIKAKAIGSLHSLCPIPETEGVCIVLDKYDKLVRVDGALVTVQAGMTLRDLNDTLAELRLALPVNGSIAAQTVSGAISTATHGGSIHYGSLSDYVEAVSIVRADGSIVELDRSQDLLQAVVVSIGLLGVISTVTFRCVPSFVLQSQRSIRKAQEVLEEFDDINRRNLYTEMLYFSITDEMEILTTNRVENADVGTSDRQVSKKSRPVVRGALWRRLTRLVLNVFVWLLRRSNSVQRYFARRSVGSYYPPRTGRSDWVLAFSDLGTSGRSPGAIQDMEIAISYEQARVAIGVLRDHFLATRKHPLFPIHIRCSSRSDLWLSPAYDREVCWLELWQYPRSDGLFQEIHELLRPFHYRFHWGKETRSDPGYIKQQYERWDDFVRLRKEWDPTGMFLNPYVASFFADSGGAAGGARGAEPDTGRLPSRTASPARVSDL